MNLHTKEQARIGLSMYNHEMSESYAIARDMLSTEMSSSQLAINGLRQSHDQTKDNKSFLTKFSKILPRHKEGYGIVTEPSAAAVRLVLNSTIWSPFRPYYFIGSKRHDKKTSEVMLLPYAGNSDAKTEPVHVWVDSKKLPKFEDQGMADELPAGVETSIYNRKRNVCIVNTDTPGIFGIKTSSDFRRGFEDIGTKKSHFEPFDEAELDDAKLAEFNVMDTVTRLATVFQVVPQLDRLLSK